MLYFNCILLVWDCPINSPLYIFHIGLTVVAWIVIVYFINLGLKQIDDAKMRKKDSE